VIQPIFYSLKNHLQRDLLLRARLKRIYCAVRISVIETRTNHVIYRCGIIWLLLSFAALLTMMGPVYSLLFFKKIDWAYIVYLSISLSSWQLISSCISNATSDLRNLAPRLMNSKLDIIGLSVRTVANSTIVFLVQHPVYVFVCLYSGVPYLENFSPTGFLLLILVLVPLTYALGIIALIYPDFGYVIRTLVQLSFFLTPVFWRPTQLNIPSELIDINPFAIALGLIRGQESSTVALYTGCGLLIIIISGFSVLRARQDRTISRYVYRI
jgi:lipopolysaccharide transport system permease protein